MFHGEVLGASPASPVDVEWDGCMGGQLRCSGLLHEIKFLGKFLFQKHRLLSCVKQKPNQQKAVKSLLKQLGWQELIDAVLV